MHSHLDIKVNGKSLVIPEDSSLSVVEKNPMFNDVPFFSYPMQIPVEGNREVLKNIAHRDSDMRAMDLEHADAGIFADGLPLNHGQVITQDGSEIKDTFEFNIDAQQQSFSELIGDLECRDVRVKDDILIGEKIGKIKFNGTIHAWEERDIFDNGWDPTPIYHGGEVAVPSQTIMSTFTTEKEFEIDAPQALGFSFPGRCAGFPAAGVDANGNPIVLESFINTSQPYPFPYCNARVAYAHPDVKVNSDGTRETDGIVKGNVKGTQKEDFGQYWCLDADRPQSGLCFYVLYFLDCLFEQLGVAFDKTDLLQVEDMKRLVFFTTHCKYDEREIRTEQYPEGKKLTDGEIQEWLNSRNCGGTIDFTVWAGHTQRGRMSDAESLPYTRDHEEMAYYDLQEEYPMTPGTPFSYSQLFDYVDCYYSYTPRSLYHVMYYRCLSGNISAETEIYEMYANSENFPAAAVSSVISSLENSFGIRFLYDPEKKTVTARLLRDIYKEKKVNQFSAKVLNMLPINQKITGVRMKYSAESDAKEQKNNVRYGVKDYDTDYDYIDFPEDRTILDMTYEEINNANIVTSTNRNVYVDKTTGNVFRIKIDAEAEDAYSLHPVLFQVGQFKGVDLGDCSEKNEDFVKEFSSEFTPLTLNVINAQEYNDDHTGNVSPILAPFLDVDMENETVPHVIKSSSEIDIGSLRNTCAYPQNVQLSLRQTLLLAESYDPTQTDSGNSPLQDIDWGLTIGVMRGGGSDAEIINFDRGYDGFDNSRWKDVVATYELTSDTMDLKGAIFDYNGSDAGDGGGERFSLAIRSWASFVYYVDSDGKLHISRDVSLAGTPVSSGSETVWQIPCDDDERDQQGNIVNKIRSRGLLDTFMREHFYALLHRKPFEIPVEATIAQLLDIRNHWSEKYVIDGKVGWINKISYNINKATGVTDVKLEFYSL